MEARGTAEGAKSAQCRFFLLFAAKNKIMEHPYIKCGFISVSCRT
jgi:hypothetical protein